MKCKEFAMRMSKFFSKPVFVAAALIVGFSFFGCEIGLGPAVDTEAPEVEVSTPDVNQSVSSDILITGTCKDDGEVDRVEVVAIRSVDGGIKYEARSADGVLGNAELTSRTTWQIPLTYTDGKYYFGDTELSLPDGTYIVDVKAYDMFNRQSTVASRSFDIDNTPPVFILSSPTSLDNADGVEYGRTIKLTGTIADAHDIDRLEIVKIYDENWNEITGLAQTVFTGFDKANTSIVIAKYSDTGSAGLSAEDLKLHQNYMAMFGSTADKFDDVTAVGSKRINLAVKIWDKAGKDEATGKDGNVSEYVYISSGLKKLVSGETSIGEGNSLDSMDYMAVLNGLYSGGALNAGDVAKVRAALKNENPTYNSTYKYISYNGEGARLSFTVDPNNSPKYSFGGFEVLDAATGTAKAPSSWSKTTTGARITINLTGGKDGGGIYPNSLNVKIYKVDASGNVLGLVAEYDNEHNRTKLATENNTSVYDIDATVPQASYLLSFPDGSDISSAPGVYYKFVVTGTDDNDNDLVPASTGGYGFGIVMSGTPPYLTSDKDKGFGGATSFGSNSNFPVYYNDADKSVLGNPINNAIQYKVYRYEGHFSTDEAKAKIAEEGQTFTSGEIPSASLYSVNGSQTQYSTQIPLSGPVVGGTDYTFVIDATAQNYQNGGGIHYVFVYYVDGKDPVLALNNASELNGKKVNRSSANVTSETGTSGTVYRYEFRGTVSDVGGSGVKSVDLSFDGGTTIVHPENDVSNVTSPAAVWTYTREFADGRNHKVWIKVTDNADNATNWVKYEDIVMDFTPPTMEIFSINNDTTKTVLDEYYNADTTIKFKASDVNGTGPNGVNVILSKWNEATSEYGNPENSDYGLNTTSDSGNLTLKGNGKFRIVAKAKDYADQWSDEVVVTTTIDKNPPVLGSISVDETDNNGYYTNGTLQIAIPYTESGSGLSKALYYITNSNGARTPSGDAWNELAASGNGGTFDITATGFTSENGGSNTLHVKVMDKAGNYSNEGSLVVKIDKGAPKLATKYMGYSTTQAESIPGTIYHKGSTQPFYLYGTCSDEGGIASVGFKIDGTTVSPAEIKYTVSNLSDETSFTNATWQSIGDISGKYNIKGWRAKFSDPADGKLTVTVTDVAGLATSVEEFVSLKKDVTPPVISGINLSNGDTIKESNLVSDKFSLQGTWSDEGGSGTNVLRWKIDSGSWNTVPSASAPKTTTAVKWFIEIPKTLLTSGEHSISVEATDAVENTSETVSITGIKCDYEAPGLEITEVNGSSGSSYDDIYGKSDSSLTFTLNATDDWGVQSVTATRKELNGTESSAATLSTLSGTDISKTITLTIPRNGSADGLWNIVLKSVDRAGRDSSPVTIATRIDGTAPTLNAGSLKIGNNTWDESSWYNSETLRITGTASDSANGSGVSKVYYRIAASSATTPANLDGADEMSVDVSSTGSFDIALSDFADNTNKVFFQTIDKAGNRSTVLTKTLKIDRVAPSFESKFYKSDAGEIDSMPGVAYIKNGMTGIYLYGTVSDECGLDGIEFKLGTAAITPVELKYTTAAPLETVGSFSSADFSVAGNASDKSGCTGWRAKFSYDAITAVAAEGGTLSATARDKAGNSTTLTNITKFTKDTTPPSLTIVTPPNGDPVTEDSFTAGKLTVSGKWSDLGGSGTKTLEWSLDGTSFVTTDVEKTEAVAESQWSFKVPQSSLPEAENTIYVRAVDAVGNTSEVKQITNPYDYHAPTITIASEPGAYNGQAAGPLVLTFNATDSKGIAAIEVLSATLDATTRTLSAGATTNPTSTTGTATVSLPCDGSLDGKWSIKVRSKDGSGRYSEPLLVSTTIDCVNPTVSVASVTVDNNAHSADKWYAGNILRVGASARDDLSGLDRVDYKVVASNDSVLSSLDSLNVSGLSGSGSVGVSGKNVDKPFTVMPTDLPENSGTVFSKLLLQSVDLAGNRSEVKVVDLNIDHTPPTAESNFYKNGSGGALNVAGGTIMNNGSSDLYIYGNVGDALSGIKTVSLKNGAGEAITATITCSTDVITNDSSVVDSGYSISLGGSGNNSIKSFKAVISSTNLPSGLVNVEVTDGAGNTFLTRLFTLEIDNTAPTVELRTPQTFTYQINGSTAGDTADVVKVNGTINIEGAAADTNLAAVKLSYKVGDSGDYNDIGDALHGSAAYNWKAQDFVVSKREGDDIKIKANGAISSFQTYTGDEKPLYFKVEAEDSAGNKIEKIYKYIIDPNSDRPEIRLNNIALKDDNDNVMSADVRVWLKSKTIYGNITDDDGAVQKLEYSFTGNGSDWVNVPLSNGTWNMTVNDDGNKEIYFKVKDAKGSEFVSKITGGQYISPVLTDGTNTPAISALRLMVDTELPEVKDLKYASAANASALSGASKESNFAEGKFGGPNFGQAKFFITAKDKNGIKRVKFQIGDGTPVEVPGATGDGYDADHEYSADFDVSALTTGTHTLKVTAIDQADGELMRTVSFNVDNEAPTVTLTVPTLVTEGASVFVKLTEIGTETYFAVTKEDVAKPADGTIAPDNTVYAANKWVKVRGTDSSMQSYIFFDGGASEEGKTHSGKFRGYLTELVIATDPNEANPNKNVKLHIMSVDPCGNVGYASETVEVDPFGDKPEVNISYPGNDSTLGGEIVVAGTSLDLIGSTSAKAGVDTVGIMMDVTGDGAWTKADAKEIYSRYSNYQWIKYDNGTVTPKTWTLDELSAATDDFSKYALKATTNESKTAWTFSINEAFNPAGSASLTVNLWVFAVDMDGKSSPINLTLSSDKMKHVTFKIDSDAPTMENETLVKKENASVHKPYVEGDSVRGAWYFEADIVDNEGISNIKVGDTYVVLADDSNVGNDTPSVTDKKGTIKNGAVTGVTITETSTVHGSGFHIKMEIGKNDTTTLEKVSKTIKFWEIKSSGAGKGTKDVIVNIDNVAPAVAASNADGYNIKTAIANMNGFYTFGSKATEDTSEEGVGQTGVARIAFYVTRDTDGHHNLFDPMIARNADGNCIDNYTSTYTLDNDDGLYWKQVHVSSVSAANEITISTVEPNLHAGGLVKVNGIIYRISSVTDGNKIKIGDKGESLNIGVAAGDDIKFALANVVDNLTQEGDGSGDKNGAGYWTNGVFDDGDLMVESLVKQGTSWTWEANINSKNIEDGGAVLHYVVFDKAGNASKNTVDVTISNNRPRIAGMTFSTDDDANGEYSDSEKYPYNNMFAGGKRSGRDVISVMFTPNDDEQHPVPLATVRNSMKIEPEVVGGNGELSYSMKVYKPTGNGGWSNTATGKYPDDPDDPDKTETFEVDGIAVEGTIDDSAQVLSIEKDVWDMKTAGITDGDNQKLTVTITDNTIGGSMSADFSMILNFAINDTKAPSIKIRPFYWNSKDSNSLYENKSTNGHIELPGDLPSDTFNGSAEFDKDPKVSGKVRIEGVAWDNAMLKEIKLKINDTVSSILTYGSGTWTKSTTLPTGVIDATVEQATFKEVKDSKVIPSYANITIPDDVDDDDKVPYISQKYGHIVKWSAVLDTTSVFGSVTGTDKTVVALVWDRGSPSTTHGQYTGEKTVDADTVQSGGDDGTGDYKNYYKMDVVPYITEVETSISSFLSKDYTRSAAGDYPIKLSNGTGEVVKVSGFNLNPTNKAVDAGNTKSDVRLSSNKLALSGTDKTGTGLKVEAGTGKDEGKWLVTMTAAGNGYLVFFTNGIATLNNVDSEAEYNKEISLIHASLNNDRKFSLWNFTALRTNTSAPKAAGATYPSMAMNGDTPQFAYVNNVEGYGLAEFWNGTTETKIYENWDLFTYTSLALNSEGKRAALYDINVVQEGSGYPSDSGGIMTNFFNNPANTTWNGTTYYFRNNNVWLDGLYKNGVTAVLGRYQYPTIKMVGNNNISHVFYSVYDSLDDRVIFRYFTVGTSNTLVQNATAITSETSKVYVNKNQLNQVAVGGSWPNYTSTNNNNNRRFSSTGSYPGTTTNPQAFAAGQTVGLYTATAGVPTTKDANGNVTAARGILVYYAGTNMYYTYATNDANTEWSDPVVLDSNCEASYISMVVDSGDHVHIAYQNNIAGDVKYIYIPTYSTPATRKTVTVDSYLTVGDKLTLDVVDSIPYIGYKGLGNTVKVAWYKANNGVPAVNTLKDGIDSNEKFTGDWNVEIIPNRVVDSDTNRLNVGVGRNNKRPVIGYSNNQSGSKGIEYLTRTADLTN